MKGSRIYLGRLLLAFLIAWTARLGAQTTQAPPSTSSTPPAQAAVIAAEEVPQAAAFAAMKELNEKKKLTDPVMGLHYGGLKQENCHGWLFREGTRLFWESSGQDYGLTLSLGFADALGKAGPKKSCAAIGIVYAEMKFRIDAKAFNKGPHFACASPEELLMMGVVGLESFTLAHRLDPAEFDKAGNKAPRFSFVQNKDGLFLKIGENQFAVSPQ